MGRRHVGGLEKVEGETEHRGKWEKVRDAKVGRDGEKKVRAVCECESCGAWEETQKDTTRGIERWSERGADEDGGGPE